MEKTSEEVYAYRFYDLLQRYSNITIQVNAMRDELTKVSILKYMKECSDYRDTNLSFKRRYELLNKLYNTICQNLARQQYLEMQTDI